MLEMYVISGLSMSCACIRRVYIACTWPVCRLYACVSTYEEGGEKIQYKYESGIASGYFWNIESDTNFTPLSPEEITCGMHVYLAGNAPLNLQS
jgi:hypothetical protein